mmetsp:Transcript_33350/g.84249  ORF Transcript_33350/g.84249 Transcript_33350/m.84249 type:complete len:233 (-) Transcript_33350:19-717(-)
MVLCDSLIPHPHSTPNSARSAGSHDVQKHPLHPTSHTRWEAFPPSPNLPESTRYPNPHSRRGEPPPKKPGPTGKRPQLNPAAPGGGACSIAGRHAYLAWGWEAMYSTALATVLIFSASESGISTANSSSNAITTSTVSRESRPRSLVKDASGVTLAGSTFWKFLTTFMTRSSTSSLGRNADANPRLWSARGAKVGRMAARRVAGEPMATRAAEVAAGRSSRALLRRRRALMI